MNLNNFKLIVGKFFLVLVLLFVVLGVIPTIANATTLSPTRLELDADPGKSTTVSIKINNDEKVKRTYYLSAAKFETQGETGDPVFVPEDRTGLVNWFSFPDSIIIDPLQQKIVDVTINVPADAKPGGYFAAVFASIIPPSSIDPQTVSIKSDVGTLVLFRVNGEFAKNDSIVEFDTKNGKHWYSNIPVEFFFRFENAGDDRAQPLGDITIKNLFGSTTKIVSANKGAGNVLPHSTRKFDSAWVTAGGDDVENSTGNMVYPKFKNFWSHVQYEWNNFAFGRYTANINLTINNDSSRTHATKVAFWIIPWHLILTILAVIVAERLLAWLWRKRKALFKSKS